MTSTNINIGFTETKNSSKVLKPPGGGHTDIFGIKGPETQTPHKRRNYPQATINSCFMHEEKTTDNKNGLKEKVDIENGNQSDVKTDIVDENTEPIKTSFNKDEEKETVEVEPPRRGRVPPGGYSSGFW